MRLRQLFIFIFCCIASLANAVTSDSLIVGKLREAGVKFSCNNSVTLLMNGQEKFDDMFSAISQAKSSVHLEYFNFRNDSIANALFALLAEKVKEGVEVRAMFDAFGNWSNNKPLKKRHLKKIREQGIEIVKFDPKARKHVPYKEAKIK